MSGPSFSYTGCGPGLLTRLIVTACIGVFLLSCGKQESDATSLAQQNTSQRVKATRENEQGQPNILLILADDLGWSDLGAWGSEIPTPVLDELASNGLMLTNFHTAPACSPSRAMLLTGQDNHQVGLGSMAELLTDNQRGMPGYEGYLSPAPTLAERLQTANYHTYMVGKWHLGGGAGQLPVDRGFEQSFALLEAGGSHFSDRGFSPMDPKAHYVANGRPAKLPENFYSSDFYTDQLLDFIAQGAADGKPFFAYAAYTAPHYPLHAPDEWIQRFVESYHGGWDQLRAARWERIKALGLLPDKARLPERHALVPAWDSLPVETRQLQSRGMAVYAAMVANLDWNIGRLLAYLDESGLRDNTVLIFISDNGAEGVDYNLMPGFNRWFQENFDNQLDNIGRDGSYVFEGPGWAQVSNLPFSNYKGVTSEGGIRVPAIINAPAHAQATGRSGTLAFIRDIYPTIMGLADIVIPDPGAGAGRSLLPLLSDPASGLRTSDDAEGMELLGHQAVIKGQWKAVRLSPPWGDGQWQLFDLESDPMEQTPVQNANPGILEDLVQEYETYAVENGVVDPSAGSVRYPLLPPLERWQGN